MSEDLDKMILPFSPQGQGAVLGWMLKNKDFAFKAKQHLKSEMFATDSLGDIFTAIVGFMDKYNDTPSIENLSSIFIVKDKQEYERYRREIVDCDAQSGQFNLTFLQNLISDWLKINIFKESQIRASKYYKQANIPILKDILRHCLEDINDIKFDKPVEYDLSDPIRDITQTMTNKASCITTGLTEFDSVLGGGLFKGEHTIIIAPVNVGKTTFCLNMLYHNLLRGKYCLFLVHEGVPSAIMQKLRQRFLQWTEDELLMAVKHNKPVEIALLKKVNTDYINKYLTFIPLLKSGGLYVEDVVSEIKRQQEQLKSKTGQYFDMIIDDYPKKLQIRTGRQMETRDKLQFIYEEFHRVAMEFECHVLSPAQINREGYKSNKDRDVGEYLSSDNISEAFGIVQDADNVITLNRSDLDAKHNLMYINVDKTRNNKNKQVIMVNTDFAKAITHDPLLKCMVQGATATSLLSPNNLV